MHLAFWLTVCTPVSLELMGDSQFGFRSQRPCPTLYSEWHRDRLPGDLVSASYLLLYLYGPPVRNEGADFLLGLRILPFKQASEESPLLPPRQPRGNILILHISDIATDTTPEGCVSSPMPQSQQCRCDSRRLFTLHGKHIRALTAAQLG